MIRFLVWLIELYQRISRRLPSVCRFQPSCSQYMKEALQTHGLLRGLFLGCRRVLRCHPFSEGGADPVPPRGCSHPTAANPDNEKPD
jgi:uncharacterized protein